MIRVEDVWKSYAGVPALRGVSLTVDSGDALLLTGPSGAGKTTLMRLVFAAERADRGEIFVAGRRLSKLSASSVPYVRRNIGVVFQDFKLLPDLSALENVALTLEILGLPRREVQPRAVAALSAVGLEAQARARVGSLAGGEKQRVAVARAIVGEPAMLLCDEPTGNLDPLRARELLDLLQTIHQRGTTLVVATHDPVVVAYGVDARWRRARLLEGEIFDVELPAASAAHLDDETQGFAQQREAEASGLVRFKPELKVVP